MHLSSCKSKSKALVVCSLAANDMIVPRHAIGLRGRYEIAVSTRNACRWSGVFRFLADTCMIAADQSASVSLLHRINKIGRVDVTDMTATIPGAVSQRTHTESAAWLTSI